MVDFPKFGHICCTVGENKELASGHQGEKMKNQSKLIAIIVSIIFVKVKGDFCSCTTCV